MRRFLSLVLPVLILVSCSDEGVNKEFASEEASIQMNLLAEQAGADIVTLVESKGVEGAMHLVDLLQNYDFNARSARHHVREQIAAFTQYFISGVSGRVEQAEPTSFETIKGLYEWNSETLTFDKSTAESFIVRFPSVGSVTNNAELTISDLQFVLISENTGTSIIEYELPTVIIGQLTVDQIKVVELNLDVTWSADGLPQLAEVFLYVDPFTFTLGFNDTFPKTTSLRTSIVLNEELIVEVDADVEFESELKEIPVSIKGFTQYRELKISGAVDATYDAGSNADINNYIDIALYLEDEKIGDIIYIEGLAYVQYEDGTKELLEALIQPTLDEINAVIGEPTAG